jgi:hypothetical protein
MPARPHLSPKMRRGARYGTIARRRCARRMTSLIFWPGSVQSICALYAGDGIACGLADLRARIGERTPKIR